MICGLQGEILAEVIEPPDGTEYIPLMASETPGCREQAVAEVDMGFGPGATVPLCAAHWEEEIRRCQGLGQPEPSFELLGGTGE